MERSDAKQHSQRREGHAKNADRPTDVAFQKTVHSGNIFWAASHPDNAALATRGKDSRGSSGDKEGRGRDDDGWLNVLQHRPELLVAISVFEAGGCLGLNVARRVRVMNGDVVDADSTAGSTELEGAHFPAH